MDIEILKSFSKVEKYIELVNESADRHRESFGFLPNNVYIEQASKGKLWIAFDKELKKPIAHLMFGGRFPYLKVTQVLVYQENRNSGIGRLLIEELIKYGEENNFIHISARVASDLKANIFWEKSGFGIISQEKGGKSRNRTINIRVRELDTMTLFKGVPLYSKDIGVEGDNFYYKNKPLSNTQIYAIDLNVFFDITKQRENAKSSNDLIRAGFNNKIKLCVSHEFVNELNRSSGNSMKVDPILSFAQQLPTLPEVNNGELVDLISELRSLIFPHKKLDCKSSKNDNSDLMHLAACIHHRVYGFVTREVAILNKNNELKQVFGIDVISPSDLCADEKIVDDSDVKVSFDRSTLKIESLDENSRIKIEKFLIINGLNEEEISHVLNSGANGALRYRVFASCDDFIIGVSTWDTPSKYTNTIDFYIYVNEDFDFTEKIIDHFIETMIRTNISLNTARINLITNPGNEKCIQTAMERGFRKIDGVGKGYLSKIFYSGPMFESGWSDFNVHYRELTGFELQKNMPTCEEFNNTGVTITHKKSKDRYNVSLFDFETLHMHGLVVCKGREAVIIPIRDCYAKELFNEKRIQEELFPSKESLLHVEKSYFRKPKSVDKFKKGMPIIFYVSGKGGGPKEVIGCARITFSDKLSPEDVKIGLSRQGALSLNELKALTDKKNKLHAITFDNFNLFPNRISYNTLKDMGCVSGANLVTSEFISRAKLYKIFKAAYEIG